MGKFSLACEKCAVVKKNESIVYYKIYIYKNDISFNVILDFQDCYVLYIIRMNYNAILANYTNTISCQN